MRSKQEKIIVPCPVLQQNFREIWIQEHYIYYCYFSDDDTYPTPPPPRENFLARYERATGKLCHLTLPPEISCTRFTKWQRFLPAVIRDFLLCIDASGTNLFVYDVSGDEITYLYSIKLMKDVIDGGDAHIGTISSQQVLFVYCDLRFYITLVERASSMHF